SAFTRGTRSLMQALSRIMLPNTARSACRSCGGRRSSSSGGGGLGAVLLPSPLRPVRRRERPSASAMTASLPARARERTTEAQVASVAGRLALSASFLFLGLDDRDLDLGLDVEAQVQLHRVQADLLDVPFHAHHLGIDAQPLAVQPL